MNKIPLNKQKIIEFNHVKVDLGGKTRLRDTSFSLSNHEIITIVGPNGGGKTSLLRAVIGEISPSAGQIYRKKNIRMGYMPQKLALDRSLPMTLDRFLRLGGERNQAKRHAALERVGAMHLCQAQMVDLSGGELQRALLARALLRQPDLLVLDEPTQGLDQPGTAAFYQLIESLRRDSGVAVLMVSHELQVVMASSDHVLCINGHICCEGSPETVATHPEYRKLFGHGEADVFAFYRHEHDHIHTD